LFIIMPLPFTPRYVELEEKGPMLIIKFNRPKAMNSMPPAMHCELAKVFKYYDTNDSLWVAIVTGNGAAFSAGFDLKTAAGLAPKEDTEVDTTTGIKLEGPTDSQGIPGGTGFAGLAERVGVKPVIAAVNGIAHGGGFETALGCDVIIASEKADFALPEPKVGLYAAAGGVIRLPRLLGYQNAMSMILTGARVNGTRAVELGIAQKVVPGGNAEVLAAAEEFAQQVLACSPDSIQASIQVAKKSLAEETNVLDAMKKQGQYPAALRMNQSDNRKEGPTAFSEKRQPKWVPPKPLGQFSKM